MRPIDKVRLQAVADAQAKVEELKRKKNGRVEHARTNLFNKLETRGNLVHVDAAVGMVTKAEEEK